MALTTSDSANATTGQEREPAFPTYAEEFNGEVEMGADGEAPIATVPLEHSEEIAGETARGAPLLAHGRWRVADPHASLRWALRLSSATARPGRIWPRSGADSRGDYRRGKQPDSHPSSATQPQRRLLRG